MRKQHREMLQNEGDQDSLERIEKNRKIQHTFNTTNRDLQVTGLQKEGKDAYELKKNIVERQREGNMARVPLNCFLGYTSYTDKFDQYDNVMKI